MAGGRHPKYLKSNRPESEMVRRGKKEVCLILEIEEHEKLTQMCAEWGCKNVPELIRFCITNTVGLNFAVRKQGRVGGGSKC